jgi:hypothetical protein
MWANSSASERGPPVQYLVYTIRQFCKIHQLSESMYYKLKALGLGPVEMEVGARRYVTAESAARWRAAREVTTNTDIED